MLQTDMFMVEGHIGCRFNPSAHVSDMSSHLEIDVTAKIPQRFTKYPLLSVPSESLMAKIKGKLGEKDFCENGSKR